MTHPAELDRARANADPGGDYGGHKYHDPDNPCPVCRRVPGPTLGDSLGPTCPVCRNRRTERLDRPVGEAHWLCPACCTVFIGSQAEWAATHQQRERHDQWLQNRQQPTLMEDTA